LRLKKGKKKNKKKGEEPGQEQGQKRCLRSVVLQVKSRARLTIKIRRGCDRKGTCNTQIEGDGRTRKRSRRSRIMRRSRGSSIGSTLHRLIY